MGLLDFLNSPDAQLGINLLAAGGPSTTPMNIGQRVQGAMQAMDSEKQNKMKLQLLQSQIDENATQNQLRQAQVAQQAKRDAYYMGDGGLTGATSPVAPGVASTPSATPGAGGGSAAPAAPAVAGDRFSQWSAQYGIPRDALVNDYLTNSGKGIAEMLMKRGTPDMQVSNGFAYDKNKLGPGYLPSLSTSQDGKTSMVQIGADGMPVVSAPRGALDTFNGYQGAQAAYKPIKVYNPATQREEFTSEAAAVGRNPAPMAGAPGNVQSPAYSGGDRNSANLESIRIMEGELAKPGINAADKAGITREIQRLKLQSGVTNAQVAAAPAGGLAAGPSSNEKQGAAFGEKSAALQADAIDKSATTAQAAADSLMGIREARKTMQAGTFGGTGADAKLGLLKFGQAIGINIDPEKVANTDYLKSTLGDGLLKEAKTLGSNPSNADASRITDIVGSIGKDPGAMAKILDWREAMARRAISQHNGKVDQLEAGGFKSQFDLHVKDPSAEQSSQAKPQAKLLDSLPTANGSNRGKRIRDTTTGKILVSNGLQWKEE